MLDRKQYYWAFFFGRGPSQWPQRPYPITGPGGTSSRKLSTLFRKVVALA